MEDCIYQDLGFFLKFMTNIKLWSITFLEGIYFIKHCVIIYLIYFQERSHAKWIPKKKGFETPGKKTKNNLNFKEKTV